jgi:hypothetical protein
MQVTSTCCSTTPDGGTLLPSTPIPADRMMSVKLYAE